MSGKGSMGPPAGGSYEVEWAEIARRDLYEIADRLFSANPTTALSWVDRIEEQAQTLTSMPYRGRVPPELLRFRLEIYREVQLPPYRMIYRVHEDHVAVLGLFDGRRDLEEVILGRLLSL